MNFPAIAPSASHNFSLTTIECKMAAVSIKRSVLMSVLAYDVIKSSSGKFSEVSDVSHSSQMSVKFTPFYFCVVKITLLFLFFLWL